MRVGIRKISMGWLALSVLAGPLSWQGVHARSAGAQEGTEASFVDVRRTTDGIPHIRAENWRGLGLGLGHVQAQDALCTLAEAFVTYEGRRSFFFGAEERPRHNATFGRGRNLDLDTFFRGFVDARAVAAYRSQQSPEVLDALEGFAEGYNRSLSEQRQQLRTKRARPCLAEAWVRPITPDDLLRRLYAAGLAAGYAHFIPEMVNAQPPGAQATALTRSFPQTSTIGERPGIGSNVMAFGREASGEGGVLFGNPHWYWGGPDRLYQAHLTIPGKLNVAGAAFLGVPVIMIGFNADVAWSHTVSNAIRFSLHGLQLDPKDPLSYRVDGQWHRMEIQNIVIPVRGEDGQPTIVERQVYRTRFGPVINLGGQSPALGWTQDTAVAIHDVNADNHRVFQNYLDWNKARSLDEFVALQKRALAMPWVNTVAIGRGDPRVWYGDIGAAPNVPDNLRQDCRTDLGDAFGQIDAKTPFLDGSRSACGWRVDPSTPQAGVMPAHHMPGLFRQDYVANMNNSHWLANPRQPLTGYATLLGGEGEALSLRARHGHVIADHVLSGRFTSSEALVRSLKQDVLTERDFAADQFKGQLLAGACAQDHVKLAASPSDGLADATPRDVDVRRACQVLARWGNMAGPDDRGALLWAAFWDGLEAIPTEEFYGQPFQEGSPLSTPAGPRASDPRVAQALAAAVVQFSSQGRPLDEPLRHRLFVKTGGSKVALFGGCGAGYFTVACGEEAHMQGHLDGRSLANTYLQLVRFGAQGVEADTLLAHGLDEAAVEGGQGGQSIRRYARQQWLRMPFTESAIATHLVQRQRLKVLGTPVSVKHPRP